MERDIFELLRAVDVGEHTEQKGNLTYLSWAWAWDEFRKRCPNARYRILFNEEINLPIWGLPTMGYIVRTEVTVGDEAHEMWLPIMDNRNRAVLEPNAMDINKAIMRCLTKNLAMFGLGLYIYAGEDLPDAGSERLGASEVKQINLLLKDLKEHIDLEAFLKHYGAESVEDIKQKDYRDVCFKLNAKWEALKK